MTYSSLLIKNKVFLRLWLGQIFSQSAIRMYQLALMWWILSVKASPSQSVAVFLIMGALPSILLIKVIARSVERLKPQKILVISNAVSSLFSAAICLCLSNLQLSFGVIYLFGFLIASCQAFFDPTLNQSVSSIVESDDLESAVSLLASTQSLASFGGAVFGAVLVDQWGIQPVLGLTAFIYLAAAICNVGLKFRKNISAQDAMDLSMEIGLFNPGLIKRLLIGFALINFFGTPTLVIMPLYVKLVLHQSATVLGLLEGTLWMGLLMGTLGAKHMGKNQNVIELGAICLASFGFFLFLPGLWVGVYFYAAALFGAGFVLGVNNVKFMTYFQEILPHSKKAAFFSQLQGAIGFLIPVAFFSFGLIADRLGPVKSCLIQGMGVVILSLYFWNLSLHASSDSAFSAPRRKTAALL